MYLRSQAPTRALASSVYLVGWLVGWLLVRIASIEALEP